MEQGKAGEQDVLVGELQSSGVELAATAVVAVTPESPVWCQPSSSGVVRRPSGVQYPSNIA